MSFMHVSLRGFVTCSASPKPTLMTLRPSEQFLHDRLGLLCCNTELPQRQRATPVVQHRFKIFQAGQIAILIKQADGDFLGELICSLEGSLEVGRIMLLLFQYFDSWIEPLVGVVLVISHTRTEHVDQ